MPDVQVEHKVTLTCHEAPRWIADLAEVLGGDGPVSLPR
jgi:hypothetical protein